MRKFLLVVFVLCLTGCAAPTVKEIIEGGPDKTEIIAKPYESLAFCLTQQFENLQAYGLLAKPPRVAMKTLHDKQTAQVTVWLGEGPIWTIFDFQGLDKSSTRVTQYIPASYGNVLVSRNGGRKLYAALDNCR